MRESDSIRLRKIENTSSWYNSTNHQRDSVAISGGFGSNVNNIRKPVELIEEFEESKLINQNNLIPSRLKEASFSMMEHSNSVSRTG